MEKTTETTISEQMGALTNRKTVLIVDDSTDQLELNKHILELADYEVFTAMSGTEALVVLDEIARPDLILLDMRMEDMSGPEFLLALEEKRPEIIENVPVVFLTALDQVPISKAVGFIKKPFDLDRFLESVHGFIELGIGRPVFKH